MEPGRLKIVTNANKLRTSSQKYAIFIIINKSLQHVPLLSIPGGWQEEC